MGRLFIRLDVGSDSSMNIEKLVNRHQEYPRGTRDEEYLRIGIRIPDEIFTIHVYCCRFAKEYQDEELQLHHRN